MRVASEDVYPINGVEAKGPLFTSIKTCYRHTKHVEELLDVFPRVRCPSQETLHRTLNNGENELTTDD